jgi:hypothetical protein
MINNFLDILFEEVVGKKEKKMNVFWERYFNRAPCAITTQSLIYMCDEKMSDIVIPCVFKFATRGIEIVVYT